MGDMIGSFFGIKSASKLEAPAAPTPPATTEADIAAREAALADERQRRIAASKSAANPTGSLGVSAPSGAVAKTLLGQ